MKKQTQNHSQHDKTSKKFDNMRTIVGHADSRKGTKDMICPIHKVSYKECDKQTQEKKCPCKEFKFEWTMKDEKAFQLGEKSGIKQGRLEERERCYKEFEKWLIEWDTKKEQPFMFANFKRMKIAWRRNEKTNPRRT